MNWQNQIMGAMMNRPQQGSGFAQATPQSRPQVLQPMQTQTSSVNTPPTSPGYGQQLQQMPGQMQTRLSKMPQSTTMPMPQGNPLNASVGVTKQPVRRQAISRGF